MLKSSFPPDARILSVAVWAAVVTSLAVDPTSLSDSASLPFGLIRVSHFLLQAVEGSHWLGHTLRQCVFVNRAVVQQLECPVSGLGRTNSTADRKNLLGITDGSWLLSFLDNMLRIAPPTGREHWHWFLN